MVQESLADLRSDLEKRLKDDAERRSRSNRHDALLGGKSLFSTTHPALAADEVKRLGTGEIFIASLDDNLPHALCAMA